MVGPLLLWQLAAGAPSGLEAARSLLEVGDTAAAVDVLERIVTGPRLTAVSLGAFALFEWIDRGAVQHPALRSWRKLREPHVKLRRDLKRGAVLLGDPAAEAVGDALIVQEGLEAGKPDPLISFDLDPAAQPTDWRVALARVAASVEARDPLVAGGVRWLLVRGLLARLDRAIIDTSPTPRCEPACFRLAQPPSHLRLLARFQEADKESSLEELGELFAGLTHAPWPFNALGGRAHAAVCALLRVGDGVAGCWPDGSELGGRDAAEVQVMAHAFRGSHQRAAQVMDAEPAWFTALDSLRDFVDLPANARPASRAWSPAFVVREPDTRVPPEVLWKAAWPLYLLPYNERLVVHRARLLLADVVWRLAAADARGLFAPFGLPASIVQVGVPLGAATTESRAILAYYPEGTHETAPQTGRGARASLPLDLAIVATGSRGTRLTGFASEHYATFGPLDHQLVQYIRDGRRQVDLHTAWHADLTCAGQQPTLALFLLDDQLRELRRQTVTELSDRRHVQLRLTLHPAVYVYSLELFDPACQRAERARYVLTVPPADAPLSDLMLADELHYGDAYRGAVRLGERAPVTIRPSLEFEAGGTTRFYWEMYGVASDTLTAGRLRIAFEIVNVREERVAVRDLTRVAREAEEAKPTMDVSYLVNVPPGDGPLTSGLAVGLPADTRGIHIARVTVTDTMTGQVARAQRAFFIRG